MTFLSFCHQYEARFRVKSFPLQVIQASLFSKFIIIYRPSENYSAKRAVLKATVLPSNADSNSGKGWTPTKCFVNTIP